MWIYKCSLFHHEETSREPSDCLYLCDLVRILSCRKNVDMLNSDILHILHVYNKLCNTICTFQPYTLYLSHLQPSLLSIIYDLTSTIAYDFIYSFQTLIFIECIIFHNALKLLLTLFINNSHGLWKQGFKVALPFNASDSRPTKSSKLLHASPAKKVHKYQLFLT